MLLLRSAAISLSASPAAACCFIQVRSFLYVQSCSFQLWELVVVKSWVFWGFSFDFRFFSFDVSTKKNVLQPTAWERLYLLQLPRSICSYQVRYFFRFLSVVVTVFCFLVVLTNPQKLFA